MQVELSFYLFIYKRSDILLKKITGYIWSPSCMISGGEPYHLHLKKEQHKLAYEQSYWSRQKQNAKYNSHC